MKHIDLVEPKSPPSVYAIAAFMDGVPGSWYRVVKVTAVRALTIGSGLYVVGFRDKQLVRGAVAGSMAITAWLMLSYGTGLLERQHESN